MGYIYCIRNTVSNKYYIGETAKSDVNVRWKQHIKLISQGKGCPALRDTVHKYGLDKFEFKVLLICFDEDRFKYEREYIAKYNSMVPNGYNILPGGIGGAGFKGKKHTPESIAKIADGTRQYRLETPDWFEHCREKWESSMAKVDIGSAMRNSEKWQKAKTEGRFGAHNGGTLSEDTKQKIRDGVNKYYQSNSGHKYLMTNDPGKIEHHRAIMAKVKGIQVEQYTKMNELIAIFPSIREASRNTGICKASIGNYIKYGASQQSEFIWKRAYSSA